PNDLPTLLVGGFGGRGSRHVQAAPETPVANFMLSLGQHFGVEMDSFGISTGTVEIRRCTAPPRSPRFVPPGPRARRRTSQPRSAPATLPRSAQRSMGAARPTSMR